MTVASHLRRCRCATYPDASREQRSSGVRGSGVRRRAALLGLAPGGVCRATPVAWGAGGLLHRRFTLTPPVRAGRSVLCGTFPRVTPGGRYPPPCSVESGLSSARAAITRPASGIYTRFLVTHTGIITRSTHHHSLRYGLYLSINAPLPLVTSRRTYKSAASVLRLVPIIIGACLLVG
jgi:hypothetical protein